MVIFVIVPPVGLWALGRMDAAVSNALAGVLHLLESSPSWYTDGRAQNSNTENCHGGRFSVQLLATVGVKISKEFKNFIKFVLFLKAKPYPRAV